MSVRKIITIDESRCNGCGLCLPNCPEGALQIIDGKVRLVSDLFCDGLGACIGYCPEGAITVVEREAEPYNEGKVMANIARQGANTIRAHLDHLRAHGEEALLAEAKAYLQEKGIPIPADPAPVAGRGLLRAEGSRAVPRARRRVSRRCSPGLAPHELARPASPALAHGSRHPGPRRAAQRRLRGFFHGGISLVPS